MLRLALVGIAGPIQQQFAYPVEDLRERRGQPLHGQIPTLVQDPRDFPHRLSLSGGVGRGRRSAHGNTVTNPRGSTTGSKSF